MAVNGITERSGRFTGSHADLEAQRARTRRTGVILGFVVALIILGGAGYMVYLAKTVPPPPALPAGPPNAQVLGRASGADMLDGNFVLSTALYRSSQSPAQVVAYYHTILKDRINQIGNFSAHAGSTLPSRSPDALQHMPTLFSSPTEEDSHAADYMYTEFHVDQSDVGIAIDARYAHGPTLVYMEMLTQPT